MSNVSVKRALKASAATSALALFMATGAPNLAAANGTVDLDFGSNIATTTADYTAVEDQLTTGAIGATVSGSTVDVTATASGNYTLDSVSGDLTNNSLSSTASANVTEATTTLSVSPNTADDTVAIGIKQQSSGLVTALSEDNRGRVIIQGDDPFNGDEVQLVGTAIADNNDISATANGNIGVASIDVSGGTSLTGTGAGATVAIDETLNAALDSDTQADLVISAGQLANAPISASSLNDDIQLVVQSVSGATLTLQNSDVSTSANGNDYTASVTQTDSTTNAVGASAALTVLQDAIATVTATTNGSNIAVTAGIDDNGDNRGDADYSTVTLTGNTQTASAYGNDSAQTLSITGNSVAGDVSVAAVSDSDTTTSGAQLAATADLVVASVQTQSGTTTATIYSDQIELYLEDQGNDIQFSTGTVSDNAQRAFAMGADASNSLTISGNDVDATGAVAAVQSNDSTVTAVVDMSGVRVTALDDVNDSTLSLTGNSRSAVVAGAQSVNNLTLADGTNNLDVSANAGEATNKVTVIETADPVNPTVNAAYALSNDQSASGGAAIATVTDSDTDLTVTDDVARSTFVNEDNSQSATAYGLTAGNAISLSFNNLEGTSTTAVSGAVVAGLASSQYTDDGSSVIATVTSEDGEIFDTVLNESVFDSSISTSSNTASATAFGNRVTGNSVTVDPTNMVLASGDTAVAGIDIATVGDRADIIVTNTQEIYDTTVTATQVSGSTSNMIRTYISNNDPTSFARNSVVSNDNVLSAAATANSAVNSTVLGSDTTATVQASSAVANYQSSVATVSATIGTAGTAGTTGFVSTNGGGNAATGTLTLAAGNLTIANGGYTFSFNSNLTAAEASYLSGLWGVALNAGDTSVTLPDGTYNFASFTSLTVTGAGDGSGDETLSFTGFSAGGSYGNPNSAGVLLAIDKSVVDDSVLTVAGNLEAAEATGNIATNSVTVTASTLSSNNTTDAVIESAVLTDADHALFNFQSDQALPNTATVYGTFGIQQAENQDVSGSTLAVTDNTLTATANGNIADNAVSLTGTSTTDANGSLLSNQNGTAGVVASSDAEIFANAAMSGSTLDLSDNTNQSVATTNSVTNAITMTATEATSADGAEDAAVYSDLSDAYADQILYSTQLAVAGNGVLATATTTVFNRDVYDTTPLSTVGSSVSFDGNSTVAQAVSNEGANSVSLDAGQMDQSGLILSQQTSTQSTTALSTATVSLDQESATIGLIDASTLTVDGNSTVARATGSTGTNTITVAGTNVDAGNTGTDAFAQGRPAVYNVNAAFAIQNEGTNNGAVTSTSDSTSKIDLDSLNSGATATALNSTLSLSDNVSAAYATGNSHTNTVTIGGDAMSSVSSNAAVSNIQTNNGLITANADSVVGAYVDNLSSGGSALSGTTLNVDGNSTQAMARGNVSTNVLNVSATLADGGTGSAAGAVANAATVSATYAVLNDQQQTSSVTSNVLNTSYEVALNRGNTYVDGDAAFGSSFGVAGNSIQAISYGNIATNGVNLTSLNSSANDATAAVANLQDSYGPITATVDGSYIGASSLGDMGNASVSVAGNSVNATAVGNFAVSRITRN